MRHILAILLLTLAGIAPATAQTYQDIDVDLPAFPEMEPIPESPVYWAPTVESNYFFYDGLYWDYCNDGWYSSAWYNGPWSYVAPVYVPTYVLWVPIRYYRRPPAYFSRWNAAGPPRWREHWGTEWQRHHNALYGGTHRRPVAAPLPLYQRQFPRGNYPRAVQQQGQLHAQHYRYAPRESVSRQQYQGHGIGRPEGPPRR